MSLASGLLSDFMKTTKIPPPHSFLLGCLVGWGILSGGYVIFKSQHNKKAEQTRDVLLYIGQQQELPGGAGSPGSS